MQIAVWLRKIFVRAYAACGYDAISLYLLMSCFYIVNTLAQIVSTQKIWCWIEILLFCFFYFENNFRIEWKFAVINAYFAMMTKSKIANRIMTFAFSGMSNLCGSVSHLSHFFAKYTTSHYCNYYCHFTHIHAWENFDRFEMIEAELSNGVVPKTLSNRHKNCVNKGEINQKKSSKKMPPIFLSDLLKQICEISTLMYGLNRRLISRRQFNDGRVLYSKHRDNTQKLRLAYAFWCWLC